MSKSLIVLKRIVDDPWVIPKVVIEPIKEQEASPIYAKSLAVSE